MSKSPVQSKPLKLALAGSQGWVGRERVARDIADIVILRPPEHADGNAPAALQERLAQTVDRAADLKPAAIKAVYEARRRSIPAGDLQTGWSIVELRISQAGHPWLGLYESNSGPHAIWMVELDEAWAPSSVWLKGSPDKRNIADLGRRVE